VPADALKYRGILQSTCHTRLRIAGSSPAWVIRQTNFFPRGSRCRQPYGLGIRPQGPLSTACMEPDEIIIIGMAAIAALVADRCHGDCSLLWVSWCIRWARARLLPLITTVVVILVAITAISASAAVRREGARAAWTARQPRH
jgi:hypothetical protein